MSNLVEIVLDCRHAARLAPFWEAALGWQIRPYDEAEIARLATRGLTPETDPTVAVDSPDGSLVFFLQEVPEPKTGKNRMHLDIQLRDQAQLNELLDLGATVLSEHEGWLMLADPEGNEFCAKHPVEDPVRSSRPASAHRTSGNAAERLSVALASGQEKLRMWVATHQRLSKRSTIPLQRSP